MPSEYESERVKNVVLCFMREYHRDNGHLPSVNEIAVYMHTLPDAVARHLKRLETEGWFKRDHRQLRHCTLLKPLIDEPEPEPEAEPEPVPVATKRRIKRAYKDGVAMAHIIALTQLTPEQVYRAIDH